MIKSFLSNFTVSYQDDVRTIILEEVKERSQCLNFRQTLDPLYVLHQNRWPEEEGALLILHHSEGLHEVPTQLEVVEIVGQDSWDHRKEYGSCI